ncbi:cadherin-like domain-containing protein [Pseudomonas sp.]|uniref:cadherin-like domain-containing protein n=1 Tax=Pseudomonas sp. TaxID=306 RepID=UPI0027377241|nr:cadherin-like domain-containing protein [Pseudomonas sp.]MDP3816247.1 cadherin-like domain-containing protein [Pseudomonas sp.]
MATFNGNDGADTLNGTSKNDTLNGLGGNDTLSGNAGDDILDGGTGDDWLSGGRGNDIYRFGLGYGHDVIDNSGGRANDLDSVQLSNLNAADIRLYRVGNDLVLTVLASGETLTVSQYFLDADHQIDRIQFADGSRWLSSDILANLYYPPATPTEGDDTLNGNPIDDTLLGLGGNDSLYGNGGNDSLDGGSGADRMEGGLGNDSYFVDDAGDLVIEAANAGDDSVMASISYSLTDKVDGSWTFTPVGDYNGSVTLIYRVNDGQGESVAASLQFTLTAVNDAPILANQPDGQQDDEDSSFSLTLPANTSVDVDGDSLTYTCAFRITGTNDAPLITASIAVMPQVSDNHSLETAFNRNGQFVLSPKPHMTEAQTVPWVSLSASGSEAFDYYVFNVTQPGTTVTLDIDYSLGFNSILSLFDAAGNFLDYRDDA